MRVLAALDTYTAFAYVREMLQLMCLCSWWWWWCEVRVCVCRTRSLERRSTTFGKAMLVACRSQAQTQVEQLACRWHLCCDPPIVLACERCSVVADNPMRGKPAPANW